MKRRDRIATVRLGGRDRAGHAPDGVVGNGLGRSGRRATAVRTIDQGTSPLRRFTSPVSYGALLRCRLVSPGPLVTLGVVVSEVGAALHGLRRPLKGRRHAAGGLSRLRDC